MQQAWWKRSTIRILVVLAALFASRIAHARVTIYLDRHGEVTDTRRIPRFGGGDRAWSAIARCVTTEFAPFDVDVVDDRPERGKYITVVVGGRPSAMGLSASTVGEGPYKGKVIPNAIDHVFSRAGNGEHDASGICASIAHEVGHSLGLDHEVSCHDIMSYSDRCSARHFTDVDARCGERAGRECDNGGSEQNSYRRLASLVGLRGDETTAERGSRRARRHRRSHPRDP